MLILLFSEVTLFEYSVSTILSPIVARTAAQSCIEGVRRESFIFSFLRLQNVREALFSTNFVDDRSLYSSKGYPELSTMRRAGFSSTFKVMEDRRSAAAAVCASVGGYGMEAASRLPLRSSPRACTAKDVIMGPLKLHFGSF